MKLKKIGSFLNLFKKFSSLFNKNKLKNEYDKVVENIVHNNEFDDYFARLIDAHDYVSARKFLDEGYEPNNNNKELLNNLAVAAFYRDVPISFKRKEFLVQEHKMKDIANLLNRCIDENYFNILDYYIGKKTVLDSPTKNMYIATEKVEKNWFNLFKKSIYLEKSGTIDKLLSEDEENIEILNKYKQDINNGEPILSKGIFNLETIYIYHLLMNKYNVNQSFNESCNKVRDFFYKFDYFKAKEEFNGKKNLDKDYANNIDVSLNMILCKNFQDFANEKSIEYKKFVEDVTSFKYGEDFRFFTILGIFDTDNFASKLGSEHWKIIENERFHDLTFNFKIKTLVKNYYEEIRSNEFVDIVERFKKSKENNKLENLLKTNEVAAIEYLIETLDLKSSKTAEYLNKIQEMLSDLENKKVNLEVKNFISNVNKEIINTLISYDELKKVDVNLDFIEKLNNFTFTVFEQLKEVYINVLKEQLKELEVESPLNKKRVLNK